MPLTPPERVPILVSYAAFILVGLSAGVSGVLLLSQIRDYEVDQAVIGLTFFTGSAGFFLAGITAGALIRRYGTRVALAIGGASFVLAGLLIATRPPLAAFILLQLLTGYGVGLFESVLNAYLAALPGSTTLLNRLHAFFGVGALLGPLLAAWMLTFTTWPAVPLVLAAICVPLTVAVLTTYPRRDADPVSPVEPHDQPRGPLLTDALRQRTVLLGSVLLSVYVGVELALGNWGFSYLVQERTATELVAGYTISGYWLGLTLGRFLMSPLAARLGLTATGLMYASLIGVIVAGALTGIAPGAGLAAAGFVLLGFFLGPIFPTTMAVAPRLTEPRLVPTAIGVMNAGSVVGGAALPWLAGALAQSVGAWTLLPFAVVLAGLQLLVWWRTAVRLPERTGDASGGPAEVLG